MCVCAPRRSEGQCESKATQNKDKMQKEATGENRDGNMSKGVERSCEEGGGKEARWEASGECVFVVLKCSGLSVCLPLTECWLALC